MVETPHHIAHYLSYPDQGEYAHTHAEDNTILYYQTENTEKYIPSTTGPPSQNKQIIQRDRQPAPTPETGRDSPTPPLISTNTVPAIKGSKVINLSRSFTPTELSLLRRGLTYIPTTKNGNRTRTTLQTEINNYHNKLKVVKCFHYREPLPHGTTDHGDKLARLRTPSGWVPQNEDLPPLIREIINKTGTPSIPPPSTRNPPTTSQGRKPQH
jgi:hypothetical protein